MNLQKPKLLYDWKSASQYVLVSSTLVGLATRYYFLSECRSRSYFTTDNQSVSQSVRLSIKYPCGTCDQILFPVRMLLPEICGLVSVGRPLWREDGSAICSAITQWSESLRTRNHILLSHQRLPQPGGPGFLIYIPQELGGPLKPPKDRTENISFITSYSLVIPKSHRRPSTF
jgi:hypothetical protein